MPVNHYRSALATLCLASLAAPATAQSLDNEGTEFLCAFLPQLGIVENQAVELHLTSRVPTTATIEYPAGAPTFSTTVNVVPGAIEIVGVPTDAAQAWAFDTVQTNLVSVTAEEEVTAYMINRANFTSDAALALPVDTLNTEFIVVDYESPGATQSSELCVFARFDATTVTITPSTTLIGGQPAGTPFDVVLNAGEGFTTRTSAGATLTGTTVEADGVIGLTNGSICPNFPVGFGFCDHLFEVAQPVQTWGTRVLAANLPLRPTGSIYRVVASVDGTDVLVNGILEGTIDRGQFLEIGPTADDLVIESGGGEAIFVAQFMTSREFGGSNTGDPAMGNLAPSAQFKQDYTFSTVGGGQFDRNFLTLIAADGDIGAVLFDGSPVDAIEFSPIGSSGFSVARLEILEGTHTTASPTPHGITVEGYNLDDSYLYPGGALFQFINPTGDANPPICEPTLLEGSGTLAGAGRDDRPSEDVNMNGVLDPGEDLNGNGIIDEDSGIFFVELSATSVNLTLDVDPFQAGDGMVTFRVSATDGSMDGTGEVVLTDGSGNTASCPVILFSSLGSEVCVPVPNSTGLGALTRAQGSLSVAVNGFVLRTRNLPNNSMGYYVNSREANTVLNPGGSMGNLCIASLGMGRHNATPLMSGTDGSVELALDFTAVPFQPSGPLAPAAGERWFWQYWYRDTINGMPTSNFCNAVDVVLE
ncbi:MAG: IgGFc-binding protein [Planctomycetota bacterium]